MAKILNIDSLNPSVEERVVVLGGERYVLKEMGVGDFIKINALEEAANSKDEPTIVDRINFMIDVILISFPTCPREVLLECDFAELNAIVAFANSGTLPGDAQVGDEKKQESSETVAAS